MTTRPFMPLDEQFPNTAILLHQFYFYGLSNKADEGGREEVKIATLDTLAAMLLKDIDALKALESFVKGTTNWCSAFVYISAYWSVAYDGGIGDFGSPLPDSVEEHRDMLEYAAGFQSMPL